MNPGALEERPAPVAAPPAAASPMGWIADGMNAVGSILIMVVMLLICADVLGRNLLGKPIHGVSELVAMSIVAIVFLQLASTLRAGRMSRAELFIDTFAVKHPRAASVLQFTFDVMGVFVFVVIVTATWPIFERAWSGNEFIGVQGVFTAPTWPVKLIVLVGAALTGLQYLLLAASSARAALGKGSTTVRP